MIVFMFSFLCLSWHTDMYHVTYYTPCVIMPTGTVFKSLDLSAPTRLVFHGALAASYNIRSDTRGLADHRGRLIMLGVIAVELYRIRHTESICLTCSQWEFRYYMILIYRHRNYAPQDPPSQTGGDFITSEGSQCRLYCMHTLLNNQ